MKIESTSIDGVIAVTPEIYQDHRGSFFESFNQEKFSQLVCKEVSFIQDNQSVSAQGVIRGLHYQIQQSQGKLVRVISGRIFDVVVDLRSWSPTFGQSYSKVLTQVDRSQLWIPPGCAHGFMALSDRATVAYKTTDYYAPQHERTILWDDPDIGVSWPSLEVPPILSEKDLSGLPFTQAELPKRHL